MEPYYETYRKKVMALTPYWWSGKERSPDYRIHVSEDVPVPLSYIESLFDGATDDMDLPLSELSRPRRMMLDFIFTGPQYTASILPAPPVPRIQPSELDSVSTRDMVKLGTTSSGDHFHWTVAAEAVRSRGRHATLHEVSDLATFRQQPGNEYIVSQFDHPDHTDVSDILDRVPEVRVDLPPVIAKSIRAARRGIATYSTRKGQYSMLPHVLRFNPAEANRRLELFVRVFRYLYANPSDDVVRHLYYADVLRGVENYMRGFLWEEVGLHKYRTMPKSDLLEVVSSVRVMNAHLHPLFG